MESFFDLLGERWRKGYFLCVGLDTDYEQLPEGIQKDSVAGALLEFNRRIIEATAGTCCAFKPNTAFYEGYGLEGIEALIETTKFIREQFPELPVILDAKRADIGNTNLGYFKAVFEVFRAHAVTVHPYLGKEALQPFLNDRSKGIFVLCHTSNPGAGEFQELEVNGEELYKIVAAKISREWNINRNCGLVMGATYPQQLAEVRQIVGEIPFLIPGIGAQGGDLPETIKSGLNSQGAGIIINASRSIIYASKGRDFDRAAGAEAAKLDRAIRETMARILTK